MRVISICLGLLLATAVFAAEGDEGKGDTPAPLPEKVDEDEKTTTEEPKKPEKVTESTTDPTTTDQPTTETITEGPTTPKPLDKVSAHCKQGYECYNYLEKADGDYDISAKRLECNDISTLYLVNPTSTQITTQCDAYKGIKKDDGFVYIRENNKEVWTCCLEKETICMKDKDDMDNLGLDNGGKDAKPCTSNFECSPGSACLSDGSTREAELKEYKKRKGLDLTKGVGNICCKAKTEDDNCQIGKKLVAYSNSQDSCQKIGGRCFSGTDPGTCIQQVLTVTQAASCCELKEEDLCPGGLYPISLKLHENMDGRQTAYDIRFDVFKNEKDKAAMQNRCKETPFAYVLNEDQDYDKKRCCPLGLQKSNAYVRTALNGTYTNTSTTQCDDDKGCKSSEFCTDVIDAVAYFAPLKESPPEKPVFMEGTKKMCFPRLECPKVKDVFSNLNKGGTGLDCNPTTHPCGEGDICVPFNGNLSVCCPFTAYSKVCVPAIANHPAIKDDGIAIQTQTCENDDTHQRRIVPFAAEDKNNAGPKVKLCCEWKSEQSQNATGKCQNGGSYMLDAKKKVIECTMDKVEEGKPCGEGYRGNCRKEDDGKFFCCNENRCPTDYFTPMNGLATCEDKNCVWADKGETMKNKYCHADKAGTKRCCPGTVSEDIKEHKIPSHELKGTSCKQPKDCGGGGKYCKDGVCWNFGSNTIPSSSKCFTNEDCDKELKSKRKFYCLIHDKPNDRGVCATHQTVVAAKAKELNTGLVAGCAVCAVMAVIFGLIATVSFLKYRSKNFCDSRKPSKKDKKSKKADKTEGTTGGGETTGTTSKVDTVK